MSKPNGFAENKPDAEALRTAYSWAEQRLKGEFKKTKPNIHEQNGLSMVSWELDQGKEKNPTYGRFPQATFKFNTGEYQETMLVLKGKLHVKISGLEQKIVLPRREIVIPSFKDVIFWTTTTPVAYFCEYEKDTSK